MSPEPWFGIPAPWCEYDAARVVIIPAPYEGTVSYGKGASRGPEAIYRASPHIELYDSTLGREVYPVGIHGRAPLTMPAEPWPAALAVRDTVRLELETARHPVVVGGEHSLTLGGVMACQEGYPRLSVLQLDAHADLRPEYQGTPFSHACVMRRVADLGVPFVQAGVRSMSGEECDWLRATGQEPFSARFILRSPNWIDRILASLSDYVYLTIDLDVLDPAEMPATGCPEPGGLSYHHLLDLALALRHSGKQIVAFDLMELAPIPGLHHPDYLAASLLYTLIGAFFSPLP